MPEKLKKFLHDLIRSPIFYIVLGAFALDLITKWIAVKCINEGSQIWIIPNFIYVTLTFNTGGIFGIGNDGSIGARIALIIVRLLLAIGIPIVYLLKGKGLKKRYKVCIMLIYAGCLGNLVDGLFYWENITGFNGVVDWIGFSFFRFIFNLADSYVTVCVFLIIIFIIVDEIMELRARNRRGEFSMTPEEYEKKLANEKKQNENKDKKE